MARYARHGQAQQRGSRVNVCTGCKLPRMPQHLHVNLYVVVERIHAPPLRLLPAVPL